MVSARNYWTTDQLWKDYHYWRARRMYASHIRRVTFNRQGWVPRDVHIAINTADMNMMACRRVLCSRYPGLRHPDMSGQLAVEGQVHFERTTQVRY